MTLHSVLSRSGGSARFFCHVLSGVGLPGRACLLLLMIMSGLLSGLHARGQAVDSSFAIQILTTTDGKNGFVAYDKPRTNDGVLPLNNGEESGAAVRINTNSARVLRNITFDYYSTYTLADALTVRLYSNDGPRVNGLKSPGTLLTEVTSGLSGGPGGNVVHLSVKFPFSATNFLPSEVTVTLQMQGLDAQKTAGWIVSESNPTPTNQTKGVFWSTQDEGISWHLFGIDQAPAKASMILAGPVTNSVNGHVYYLLQDDTWEGSENAAIALGGHLVTINDAAEQDWVFSQFGSFGGVPRHLWLGLRRAAPGGPLYWVNGERPAYSHWLINQPSSTSTGELNVHMVKTGDSKARAAGFWNNLDSPNAMYPEFDLVSGVVEIQPAIAPEVTLSFKAKTLSWSVDSNRSYQVQSASTVNGPWTNFGVPVNGAGTVSIPLGGALSAGQGYFRVMATP